MKPADDPSIDYRALVRKGYDQCAGRYEEIRSHNLEPRLEFLIERLDPGSKVLDLGCGPGIPIARELSNHFKVTGVDISEEMIRRAQHNVPKASFLHADVLTVSLPELAYDAVVSFYAIFHIPREQHNLLFSRIYSWLRNGGYLLVTLSIDSERSYTETFLGGEMYWSNYGISDYRVMIDKLGFNILLESSVGHGYIPEYETSEELHPLVLAQKVPVR